MRVLPFLTVFAILSISTTSNFNHFSAQPEELSHPVGREATTITIRSFGTGKNEAEAITDAILNAFETLFFRGIPESEQKEALIGSNENELRTKNSEYFNQFYKGRFGSFVLSTVPASPLMKLPKGKKSIAMDVTINLYALKKDLEENNIIRKFGF